VLDVSSESFLRAIFHTLAYADVFEFPLRAPEVYRYLTSTRATLEQVRQALADETRFSQVGDYFTLRGREQALVAIAIDHAGQIPASA